MKPRLQAEHRFGVYSSYLRNEQESISRDEKDGEAGKRHFPTHFLIVRKVIYIYFQKRYLLIQEVVSVVKICLDDSGKTGT